MAAKFQVEIEPAQGFARLAGARVELAAQSDGALLVNGSARVRAVTFGERGHLLTDALASDDAASALADLIAGRSVLEVGSVQPDMLQALSLALAGGSVEDLPFAEAARRAGERQKWNWEQTLAMPAWLVDRAAAPQESSTWNTFVFPVAVDLDELASAMALNLLRRSVAPAPTEQRPAQAEAPAAKVVSRGVRSRAVEAARSDLGSSSQHSAATQLPSRSVAQAPVALTAEAPVPAAMAARQNSVQGALAAAAAPAEWAWTQSEPAAWAATHQSRQQSPVTAEARAASLPGPLPALMHVPPALDAPIRQVSRENSTGTPSFPAPQAFTIPDSPASDAVWGRSLAEPAQSFPAALSIEAQQDWSLALARALEAECDLRGIL